MIAAANSRHASKVDDVLVRDLVAAVPDLWLPVDPVMGDAEAQRDAYVRYLRERLGRRARSSRRPTVPAPRDPFQYAIVRVLPRVERGECLNVGMVLLCRPRRFLGARIELDERRLGALAPHLDPATSGRISTRSSASPTATSRQGRSRGEPAERFHWLVSPSSTMIQPSEVHSGLCDDPAAELDHLVTTLVRQGPAPFEADPGVAG